ncbi:MAG: hypothetical protein ACJ71F_04285, partial [Nitrososphaeraceae archaeon]
KKVLWHHKGIKYEIDITHCKLFSLNPLHEQGNNNHASCSNNASSTNRECIIPVFSKRISSYSQ